MENLEVLKVGEGNNEQALVDLQLSLAAYTQLVVKNLGDSIPKLVYAQLVGKVPYTCAVLYTTQNMPYCFRADNTLYVAL